MKRPLDRAKPWERQHATPKPENVWLPGSSQLMRSDWQVDARYDVDELSLYPRDGILGSYHPLANPQLVTEFARLHRGDRAAVVSFTRRWGRLGHAELFGYGDSPEAPGQVGELVSWISAHAAGVGVCLNIIFYLQAWDWLGLESYLGSLGTRPVSTEQSGQTGVALTLSFGLLEYPTEKKVEAPTLDQLGHAVLQAIINPNLAGVLPTLDRVENAPGWPSLVLSCRFVSLSGAIYWQLAELAAGSKRLARCEECQELYVQTDRRQQFCRSDRPVLDTSDRRRVESRCALRNRKRRLRHARQAEVVRNAGTVESQKGV